MFDVRAYGAAGNGGTDDTAAIQRTIDAASAAGGGTVSFPPGIYRTSDTLRLRERVNLSGEGPGSTIHCKAPVGAVIEWQPSAPGIALNAMVENLKLETGTGCAAVGLRIVSGYTATVRNVWILSPVAGTFPEAGIHVTDDGKANSAAVRILYCHVQGCAGDAVRIAGGSPAAGISVFFNRFQDNSGWGLNAAGGNQVPAQVTIESNVIEGNRAGAITGSFWASAIRNNHFENAAAPEAANGALIRFSAQDMFRDLEVAGNIVGNPAPGAAGNYGFDFNTGLASFGLRVASNFFTTARAAAIRLRNVHGVTIADNVLTGINRLLARPEAVSRLTVQDGVQAFGARGDGAADDTTAIQDAIDTAAAMDGEVYFPPGTYRIDRENGIELRAEGVTLRGAGAERTRLLAGPGCHYLLMSSTQGRGEMAVRDLTLDGATTCVVLVSFGSGRFSRFELRDCTLQRFLNAVTFDAAHNVTIERCTFHNHGRGIGTGVQFVGGGTGIRIADCRFLWSANGVLVSTLKEIPWLAREITIEGCTFDLGWYTLPALLTRGEGTARYEESALADRGLLDLPADHYLYYLRVLRERRAGEIRDATPRSFRSTGAGFLALQEVILPGEIVRVQRTEGGKAVYRGFAVIAGVVDDETIEVEEWLDDVTRLPLPPPPPGTQSEPTIYHLYQVILGRIAELRTDPEPRAALSWPWFDLNGRPCRPPDGLPYEFLPKSNYPIEIHRAAHDVKILHNTFKRGYSDQISVNGDEVTILGNHIAWGQDMGITLNGTKDEGHSIVAENRMVHQGVGGMWVTAANVTIANNVCQATTWVNPLGPQTCAGIMLGGARWVSVVGNVVDGMDLPLARTGISLWNVNDVTLSANVVRRIGDYGVTFFGYGEVPGPKRVRIGLDNLLARPVRHFTGATGGLLEVESSAAPGPLDMAAPASTLRDLAAGRLYFKAQGYEASGWREVGTHLRGTGAPASGTWSTGDVVVNESPSSGNPYGWICVAGGSPGTWKPFGRIED